MSSAKNVVSELKAVMEAQSKEIAVMKAMIEALAKPKPKAKRSKRNTTAKSGGTVSSGDAEGDAIPDDWEGWKSLHTVNQVKEKHCLGRRAEGSKFYEGITPKLFTEQLCKYEEVYGSTEGLCKFCYARKANYEKFKADPKCKSPSIKADYYGKIGEEIPADAHFQGTDWCKRKARLTEAEPEADADAIPVSEGGEQLDEE